MAFQFCRERDSYQKIFHRSLQSLRFASHHSILKNVVNYTYEKNHFPHDNYSAVACAVVCAACGDL